MIEKKNILGVGITNATKDEILEYIIRSLENFKKKLFFVTPNPEFLVIANKNPIFKNILNRADLALTDGFGVILAGKILGKFLKERFAGIELLESLCLVLAEKPITVGFLGGSVGVAEKTAECLMSKYPGLKVGFVGSTWPVARGPVAPSSHPMSSVASSLRALDGTPSSRATPRLGNSEKVSANQRFGQRKSATIDVLFVAFGAPKQEMWISENLEKIPVKIAIGVGGAFDYISGKVPRAPDFIQKLGFEWLFRLIVQPWRIKRQLALLEFIYLVFKEKFFPSSKP